VFNRQYHTAQKQMGWFTKDKLPGLGQLRLAKNGRFLIGPRNLPV
jgi:hypothetical protein